ncbi:hypothetical protein Hamer_G029354, partial [Homarus americanus]
MRGRDDSSQHHHPVKGSAGINAIFGMSLSGCHSRDVTVQVEMTAPNITTQLRAVQGSMPSSG